MRNISLFALILFSTTLLSESYHHAEAIGIDSASHGLLYGGRVVRRYSDIYKGLQEMADPIPRNLKDAKAKVDPKAKVPKTKATKIPKANSLDVNLKDVNLNNAKGNDAKSNDVKEPKQKDAKPQVPDTNPQNGDNGNDDTTTSQNTGQDQTQSGTAEAQGGIPTVATGGLSKPAAISISAVGGVFVLVGGLFAFSQRKKNKEMTKSIVSSSAKAWEQQNSIYEIMEEETKPIGSYIVTATYTPTLADELDIQPGDKVTILIEYDDGWVQGINETRGGTKGVFPRHCVDMSHTPIKNNKRLSSIGGYTEGYTEVDLN